MISPFHAVYRPWALALLVLLGTGSSRPLAAGAPVQWPPLGDVTHPERHPGKMIWADLVTPDLSVAERFYGGMFGWKFETLQTGVKEDVLVTVNGRQVGCLLQRPMPAGEPRQSTWLAFFAVRDVDAARSIALKNGAKSLWGPKTFEGHGRQAVLSDPEGAVFGMLASSTGDPSDDLAAPGEWIWSAALVPDPDQDAAFYQKLFDYDVFALPSEGTAEHLILSSDDLARASVNTMPGDASRRHPHWLSFIRVTDTEAAAATAVTLGGRILVKPHVDRHGGKTALIADPAGAPIGLMEWNDSSTKMEPK